MPAMRSVLCAGSEQFSVSVRCLTAAVVRIVECDSQPVIAKHCRVHAQRALEVFCR